MLDLVGIPKQILNLAATQGGYVTRSQLIALEVSESAIDRRVNGGDFKPVAHGIYVVIPSEDPVDLIRGATLALPKAVASHQSAAHLLRFPKRPTLQPTVIVPSHTTHRFPGVTVRRCDDLMPSDTVQIEGLAVTNTARTLFDLGRLLDFKEYDAIGEALVVAGRMDLETFEQTVARLARRGKPGTKAAKDFLDIRWSGSDRRATILERKGTAVLSSVGLPSPIAQFPVPWEKHRRFDAAYPEASFAIEWDSRTWHEQRRAMAADRRRDRQASMHGWTVLRFTWEDVTERPQEVIAAVSTLLNDRRAAG